MGRLEWFRLAEGCLGYQGRCLMLWGLGNLVPINQWMAGGCLVQVGGMQLMLIESGF